jgi:hypothetical protein
VTPGAEVERAVRYACIIASLAAVPYGIATRKKIQPRRKKSSLPEKKSPAHNWRGVRMKLNIFFTRAFNLPTSRTAPQFRSASKSQKRSPDGKNSLYGPTAPRL